MNTSAQQYLSDSDSPSLTPQERAAVRLSLQAKMAFSLTADEKTDIRRALQHVVYSDAAPASAWSWLRMPIRLPVTVFSILLLLGVSSGGLAYAAESAVPGDALYGVKIYVNEAIRGKMQWSPAQRASWAVAKLQRRLDEVRRLEARGQSESEIDVAIGDHVESAAHNIELEVESLPAAAAERAAMRTAVNAAIGTDQDSLRRASRVNRVLKALKERAERFDAPTPTTIAPVPSGNARQRNEVKVEIERPLRPKDPSAGTEGDTEADAEIEVDPVFEAEAHAETQVEVDVPDVEVPKLP